MNQLVLDTQIRSLIKLTIIKLNQYNETNSSYQHQFRKILSCSETIELSITKIIKIQTKNDYQHLILMTFIAQLISIFMVFSDSSRALHLKVQSLLDQKIIDLIGYSSLSKQVQNYYYLKKMETIRLVFEYKLSLPQIYLPFFSKLYHLLRNCQTTDSNTTKQHYKLTFVNIHKHLLTHSKHPDILDFIFSSLVNDSLVAIEEFKKDETEGMRVLDSRLLAILFYLGQSKITPKQLAMVTYLLVKASLIENSYINGLSLSVSEALLNLLTNIESPLILIVINHVVVNPLIKLLTTKPTSNTQLMASLLFNQLEYIFKHKRLLFSVLKLSDINIYSESLIQKLLTQLHQFVDQEEKKPVHDSIVKMVKQCLKNIMISVKNILDTRKETELSEECQKIYKFYKIKQKSYLELVDKFNNEPKTLVKGQPLSDYKLDLLAHFLRRSPKIKVQKMIECLGLPSQNSGRLLWSYLATFNFKKFSVEESLRVLLSNFFLIGQSQQISRVSEQLSNLLYQNDKQKYEHSDNVYVFCSALLILNTDLHNPQNEKKMTEPQWLKMCNTIKGVTSDQLLVIHNNISKNKIQNFRDMSHLDNINYTCFMYNFHTDKDVWNMSYADPELKVVENNTELFKYMSYQFLQTILVGKQITKLDKLIDVWEYKEDVYECEILEIIKTLVSRGQSEVPESAVRRMLSKIELNSSNNDVHPKSLSYYWLMSKIIIQHPDTIATEIICSIINSTYMIRLHLQDDLCCRQLIKIRRIKDSLKWFKSKSIKKKGSILDIFANFLGQKQSSDEEGTIRSNIKRPMTFKKLGAQLYQILGFNKESRTQAIQYFLTKIRDEKTKVPVGQFIFTLYILFDLVCLSSNLESIHSIEILLNQILMTDDSALGKRLLELQRRKEKKYDLIIFLTKYYTLKILLENPFEKLKSAGLMESAVSIVQQCNTDLLREFVIKIQALKVSMKEEFYKNDMLRKVQEAVLKNIKDNGNKQEFELILQSQEEVNEQKTEVIIEKISKIESQEEPKKQIKQQAAKEEVKQETKQQIKKVAETKQYKNDQTQQKPVKKLQSTEKQQLEVNQNESNTNLASQKEQTKQVQNQALKNEKQIQTTVQNRQVQHKTQVIQSQILDSTPKDQVVDNQNDLQNIQQPVQKNNQPQQQQKQQQQQQQVQKQQNQQRKQEQQQGTNKNIQNQNKMPFSDTIKQQQVQQLPVIELSETDRREQWQNVFNFNKQTPPSSQKQDLIDSGNNIPLPDFNEFNKHFQDRVRQQQQQRQDSEDNQSKNKLKHNQFTSQQQLLKAQEQEINKLMSGLSQEHIEKLGLPIYML